MKTLVLYIDKGGRRSNADSLVIVRKENLEAAKKLALADPEYSDVNCMFFAISTYDKLEEDVEIARGCIEGQSISNRII